MITQNVRIVASSDDSDLEFNRRGRLSPAQSAQLSDGAVGALVLGSLFALLGFLITMVAWSDGEYIIGLLVGGPVIALGGFMATRPRPQTDYRVQMVHGVLTSLESMGDEGALWCLRVGDVEMFTGTLRLVQNLSVGSTYTFFFASGDPDHMLLSWERDL